MQGRLRDRERRVLLPPVEEQKLCEVSCCTSEDVWTVLDRWDYDFSS
jgi:hypothetical protein